jgi:hypothetical protein
MAHFATYDTEPFLHNDMDFTLGWRTATIHLGIRCQLCLHRCTLHSLWRTSMPPVRRNRQMRLSWTFSSGV